MTVAYLGSLTLADALPGAAAAGAAGVAGIGLALPDLSARLSALASFAPIPSNFAADIALAQSIVVSIEAAITAGISPPSLDAQVAIVAGLVADLEAALSSINAQLSLVTDFLAILGTGGIFGYTYAGPANGLGGDFTTELASGFPGGGATDATNAILLATTTPATWTAMSAVFKVTP